MQRRLKSILALLFWATFMPVMALGEPSRISRELHAWGRFEEGAWKCYQVTTKGADGEVLSVAETKITLKERGADGVTLFSEMVTEIGGRRLVSPPVTTKYSFHGEAFDAKAAIKDLGSHEIAVDGQTIPCRIEQIEASEGGAKTVTKVWYTPDVAPYVLRRESVTTDASGGKLSEMVLQAVALEMPYQALNRFQPASHVEVVVTTSAGKAKTAAYLWNDVPGGVVSQKTSEYDAQGKLLRTSELVVLAYGLEREKERRGLLERIRDRHRAHRTSR